MNNSGSPTHKSPRLWIWVIVMIGLAVWPALEMAKWAMRGESNPSNDDVMFYTGISAILRGSWNFGDLLRGCFGNGHFLLFPFFGHLGVAYLAQANIHVSIGAGIFLGLVRLGLLFDALTQGVRSWWKWLWLPALSTLIFSASQLSGYEFDFISWTQGLASLGFCLGLWALVRFPDRRPALLGAILGGLLAAWSSGGGILSWPAFIIGMWLLGFRKRSYYLALILAALLSAVPYVYFLLLNPKSAAATPSLSWFNLDFLAKLLGAPFAPIFSEAGSAERGWIGLGLLISAAILALVAPKFQFRRPWAAAAMVLSYGIFRAWQVMMFRGRGGVAPWYASISMWLWIGLFGLSFLFLLEWAKAAKPRPFRIALFPVWSGLLIFLVAYFFLTSNRSYEDKSFFLKTRAPVSVSCLRNFAIAPTYCETALFLWSPQDYPSIAKLALPLWQHKLGIFGARQTWSLQGDYNLPTVKTRSDQNSPPVRWFADRSSIQKFSTEVEPLNLFLHSPNQVEWTVSLPPRVKSVFLYSAVKINDSAPELEGADGVLAQVFVDSPQTGFRRLFEKRVEQNQRSWIPFRINLTSFAGKTLKIVLASDPLGNRVHDWLMFRHPELRLELRGDSIPEPGDPQILPSNVDDSPWMPLDSPSDFVFHPTSQSWKSSGPGLCLADYEFLVLRASAEIAQIPRFLEVFLRSESGVVKSFLLPLLRDEATHRYAYDLKLLNLPEDFRLGSLDVEAPGGLIPASAPGFRVSDLRLSAKPEGGACD